MFMIFLIFTKTFVVGSRSGRLQSEAMTTVIHLESFAGYKCEVFKNAMKIYDTSMADNNISPPCDHVWSPLFTH